MRLSHAAMLLLTLLLALLALLFVSQWTRARAAGPATVGAPPASEGRSAAAERRLAAEGEGIALLWCASCHAVGADAQDTALSDAPSFRLLAEEPFLDGATILELRTAPHPAMPEFPLTRRHAEALAAFIRSVRSAEPYDPHGLWRQGR